MAKNFPFTERQFREWLSAQPPEREVYAGINRPYITLCNCCPLAQFALESDNYEPKLRQVAVFPEVLVEWRLAPKTNKLNETWSMPKWARRFIRRVDRAAYRASNVNERALSLITFGHIGLSRRKR